MEIFIEFKYFGDCMEPYAPTKVEEEVLNFWLKKRIYEKQKAKGKKGPKFYWLCGPPYTSGKFHVGHFWNYASLKDPLFRYKRMKGFDVWDRGGWDMHGLPTSRKVMAKLGLKTKDDIEAYGVDKFVKECEKFSKETMEKMTEDYVRWGVWFDHKNAYQPIKSEFMEGVWWGIKKAWENGFLYEGEKVMAWCPESETVAAKHELEYKEVTDDSVYLKFKVKSEKDTYLIIWTTTPWTIPHNLAVMANPNITYVYAKADGETWIVAKDLLNEISKVSKIELKPIKEVKGKELEGLEYEPLLEKEVPVLKELKKKYKWAFKVLLSEEYVDTESGTGLVHCAPGCGPEDQEVGKKYGLPAFNEVDSKGYFSDKMGEFKGLRARFDDKKFIEHFKKIGALVARVKYKHEYPFHERSKAPVIFRTTKQWFFAVEKIKDKLREWNKQVNWIPKWAGEKTFDNWLANLKDIGITRQRYWGTPIPIWKCDSCGHFIVVGSLDELKKLSGKKPKNMHKPWIDEITFKCEKCKGTMKRIPDIADVWLDAGCTSWISLYFPQRRDLFEKYWPADFILEAKEQIRGWFNLLFDTAGVTRLGLPFKNCYMTGWVNDAAGRKMSKSLGNIIDPYEVVDKYGTDTVRYYMMGSAQPGVDMNYNFKDIKVKFRNLTILWNICNFLIDFVKTNRLKIPKNPGLGLEEKYILSRTNNTLKKVSEYYDSYKLNDVPGEIEKLFLDISRFYIKSVRDKSVIGSKQEKEVIAFTLFESLLTTLKMFGTVAPFISEKMYQNLKSIFKLKEESIQLFDWPSVNEEMINEEIEESIEIANDVITAILSIRDKKGIGVRWPLSKVLIYTKDKAYAIELAKEIILKQCNVKEIEIIDRKPEWVKLQIKVHHNKLAKKFKEKVPKIVGTLIQMSPEAVKSKLDNDGKVVIEVDEEKYEVTPEEIYIEEELPQKWGGSNFDYGNLYLDLKQTKELLAEGFAREIIRRIQDLRKELKLQKTDKAKAVVALDKELKEMIEQYVDEIEQRTGTVIMLKIGKETSEKANIKVSVKGNEIAIGLNPA